MKKFALGLAVLLALPTAANAAAFMNGGFETGVPVPGAFVTLGNGSTDITGWTVTGNGVDYIGSYWQNGAGDRSVDLSGNAGGGISQTFDTVFGTTYVVNFLLAGNPAGEPTVKDLNVQTSDGTFAAYTFDTTGTSLDAMGWLAKSYTFTANSNSTTLSFSAGNRSAYGAAIDGVTVAAVPEPATWALLLGGFALVGTQMRRRRGTAVSFA